VREACVVTLPGGDECLVAAVIVVVPLEPVEGAGPGDASGSCVLAFIVRVQRGGERVVPGPLLLDVCEPDADVGGGGGGSGGSGGSGAGGAEAWSWSASAVSSELNCWPRNALLAGFQKQRCVAASTCTSLRLMACWQACPFSASCLSRQASTRPGGFMLHSLPCLRQGMS
jgi:hypothetical protein